MLDLRTDTGMITVTAARKEDIVAAKENA